MPKGKLIIFSAPSGAGKTSIVKEVLQRLPGLVFSVSACSRPMRSGEADGTDYYFLTPEVFRKKIDEGAFLEWEEVYPGNYYGTLHSEVKRIRDQGKHVVFDVDVAGGMKIKQQFKKQSLALFIQPPSLSILRHRLVNRGTETEESLNRRLGKAEQELTYARFFDYVIINHKLEDAISEAVEKIKQFISQT